ncbi:jg13659 [Pararge aegeria aegeria]|uniref:Jg13659 protein n=1 Tax=Pararge aegeria aegeria TaxID=348720 RepID=A0A8S4S9W5_9NEOP|nr:jg13659 [Pararge aegeria aegeria]
MVLVIAVDASSSTEDADPLNSLKSLIEARLEEEEEGYLIPLLIHLYRVDVTIVDGVHCPSMWDYEDKYLCIKQPKCKDDLGSVLVCSGYIQGMMTSRLIDRPCGVGFVDLSHYNKFLTCGVDDSRDVIDHEDFMSIDYKTAPTPSLITTPHDNVTTESSF